VDVFPVWADRYRNHAVKPVEASDAILLNLHECQFAVAIC
jgi:hypothetical protein